MTTIAGQIVDQSTGQGLANATISVNGSAVGFADANGVFNLSIPDSSTFSVSYVGYDSQTAPVDSFQNVGSQLQLTQSGSSLQDVVVTAVKKNPQIVWGLAGVGALILLTSHKKKKMGKIDTTTILLIAGGAAAIYLLTRPKPATALPVYPTAQNPVYYSGGIAVQQANPTAQIISAGGSALQSISNLISNFTG